MLEEPLELVNQTLYTPAVVDIFGSIVIVVVIRCTIHVDPSSVDQFTSLIY